MLKQSFQFPGCCSTYLFNPSWKQVEVSTWYLLALMHLLFSSFVQARVCFSMLGAQCHFFFAKHSKPSTLTLKPHGLPQAHLTRHTSPHRAYLTKFAGHTSPHKTRYASFTSHCFSLWLCIFHRSLQRVVMKPVRQHHPFQETMMLRGNHSPSQFF